MGELLENTSGTVVLCTDANLGSKTAQYEIKFEEGVFWTNPDEEEQATQEN